MANKPRGSIVFRHTPDNRCGQALALICDRDQARATLAAGALGRRSSLVTRAGARRSATLAGATAPRRVAIDSLLAQHDRS